MGLASYLAGCPLVAILRGVTHDTVGAIGDALDHAGFTIVEVPLNSPDPLRSIEILARRLGAHMLVGAGTVRTPAQVSAIAAAGGRLIVMPHADATVVRAAKAHDLLAVPGFFTPTEAFAMLDAGADALKLFPAEAASPNVLKAMRAVLPKSVAVLPVGGIDATNLRLWLDAGAAGFGIGSAIYKSGDSAAVVAQKAATLQAALRAAV